MEGVDLIAFPTTTSNLATTANRKLYSSSELSSEIAVVDLNTMRIDTFPQPFGVQISHGMISANNLLLYAVPSYGVVILVFPRQINFFPS